MAHPIQDLHKDEHGVVRFKKNAVVDFLYNTSKNKLNELMQMNFTQEDIIQFYMLLGVSISHLGELDFVPDKVYYKCRKKAVKKGLLEE